MSDAENQQQQPYKKKIIIMFVSGGNSTNYSASLCVHVAGCRFPFSRRPLDNETQTSDGNKSKGRKERQAMRSDARSKGFVFFFFLSARYGFVSPYLVCQSKKIPLSAKMQMLRGTRTSSKTGTMARGRRRSRQRL